MDVGIPVVLSTLLDSVLVLAGHGDSITGNPVPTSDSGSDDGGISMVVIAGVVVLAVVAVAVMVWLDRQEKGPRETAGVRPAKLKSVVPLGLLAAVIATPLILWTASSGGDEKNLRVERWLNDTTNSRELLISLRESKLNSVETTNGRKSVRVVCLGRDGETVLVATQKWPFILERGYEWPHAHQKATAEQLRRADRCRLRGTNVELEADVKGSLTG